MCPRCRSKNLWIKEKTLWELVLSATIAQALGRIADGTYGTCLECEEPISEKRRAALPWAKYCIHCQEHADRNSVNMRWDTAA